MARRSTERSRDLAAAMAEAEREAQAKTMSQLRERLMLGPADHRDWLTAMSWFAALNPPELRDPGEPAFSLTDVQKVLIWRLRARSIVQPRRCLSGIARLHGHEGLQRFVNGEAGAHKVRHISAPADGTRYIRRR